ncbi:hypothetical protein L7F22_043296 [Adiantum nelumboides]|nr:hypothetical protein [Adiantum nelumboides]
MAHVAILLLSRCPSGVISTGNLITLLLAGLVITALALWAYPGGPAWGRLLQRQVSSATNRTPIPGPRGWPLLGSLLQMGRQAHIQLAKLAHQHSAKTLMAFSVGNTPMVLTCVPAVARELLCSPAFADRPIKESAKLLLFDRAIGFAPYGDYWRKLRRIAATHLFSPKRMAALRPSRQSETSSLLQSLHETCMASYDGRVLVRPLLQAASLNNIMKSVFGKRYDLSNKNGKAVEDEGAQLQRMTREGFELLGAFNWGDHLPLLKWFDVQRVNARCKKLVADVQVFVQRIIEEHRVKGRRSDGGRSAAAADQGQDESDFVDVMLSLQSAENLRDTDLIAVLWEMIFRGTDTTAILMEWILAEMVLHPQVQARAQAELDREVGLHRRVEESDMGKLPYLQAIVKECLRLHPPGPLLSWARLATSDVDVAGFHVPAGTTAMVNMWAITHDPDIWEEPTKFKPERFLVSEGGMEIDIRGNDLRLAPFGAGRRVCPGKALGLATVHIWTARLLHHFKWSYPPGFDAPLDLSEVLKLSCEMKTPLVASATRRIPLPF